MNGSTWKTSILFSRIVAITAFSTGSEIVAPLFVCVAKTIGIRRPESTNSRPPTSSAVSPYSRMHAMIRRCSSSIGSSPFHIHTRSGPAGSTPKSGFPDAMASASAMIKDDLPTFDGAIVDDRN